MRTQEVQLTRARGLRHPMTKQEKILWEYLRNHNTFPYHFKRQQPMGIFIVDFFCHEKKLIIELDGSQHATDEAKYYDHERTSYLKSKGYTVIRFWNKEVDKNLSGVLEIIRCKLSSPMFGEETKSPMR